MPGGLRQAGWGIVSTLTLLVASGCLSSVHALRYQDLGECLLPCTDRDNYAAMQCLDVPCQACLVV